MRSMRKMTRFFALIATLTVVTGLCLLVSPSARAQATVGTGSVQGAILDPNGNTVSAAKVTISRKGTGQVLTPEVSSNG